MERIHTFQYFHNLHNFRQFAPFISFTSCTSFISSTSLTMKPHRNQVLGMLLLALAALVYLMIRYWKHLG